MDLLHRYFFGVAAFAAVVVAATLGVTTAVVALVACIGVVHGDRIVSVLRRPRPVREPRPRTERELHRLVPDEPSLVLNTYP